MCSSSDPGNYIDFVLYGMQIVTRKLIMNVQEIFGIRSKVYLLNMSYIWSKYTLYHEDDIPNMVTPAPLRDSFDIQGTVNTFPQTKSNII